MSGKITQSGITYFYDAAYSNVSKLWHGVVFRAGMTVHKTQHFSTFQEAIQAAKFWIREQLDKVG